MGIDSASRPIYTYLISKIVLNLSVIAYLRMPYPHDVVFGVLDIAIVRVILYLVPTPH